MESVKKKNVKIQMYGMILVMFCVERMYCIPAGFGTFFFAESCPENWYSFVPAEGRLIVSVANSHEAGITVGIPLNDREDRVHTHNYYTTLNIPSKSIAAIDCCNDQGACNKEYPVSGQFESGPSGYPFCQLLFCVLNKDTSDPVPFGTVGFFESSISDCPPDFTMFSEANGRIILPSYSSKGGVIPSLAPPLKSGEDRTHNHFYFTNVTTTDVSYEGAEGCCNSNTAQAGTYDITGNGTVDSSSLPYIQLLTCISQQPSFQSVFPPLTLLFNVVGCPPGWNVSLEAAGRFLVALPNGGQPGATFGGPSLAPGFTGSPTHTHEFRGEVTTDSCGVGLASGCCGSGYAGNNVYPFKDTTASSSVELSYLSIPMCIQL